MNTIGKILVALGMGIGTVSIIKTLKKTKNAICSPLMETFFEQAYDELKREKGGTEPTSEEVHSRVREKIRDFQNRK